MKLVQVTYSGFGGLGSVVFSLVGADREKFHEWSIGFIGDLPIDESYPQRCDDQKIGYAAFRSTAGRPYRAWWALYKWLEVIRPDAIICHSINSILPCRWHAWKRRVPLIAVEHTPNQVKTQSEWAASRLCMLLADRVVVLSRAYQAELSQAHGRLYRPGKVCLIPNGIDTQDFRPEIREGDHADRPIRLGMAARFSFSKRQDLLIDVIERIAQTRCDKTFELELAGDGSERLRVEEKAAKVSGSAKVRFVGLLSEDAVASWLRTLDIYVHATEGETLSTSILQAMATGLPIVASDIPGVRNLLADSEAVGVCAENEVLAFAEAVLKLVDSSAERSEMAQRARQSVEATYSCDAMLAKYLELVADVRKDL